MGQGFVCRGCDSCPIGRPGTFALFKDDFLRIRDLMKGPCSAEERARYESMFKGYTWVFWCREHETFVFSPTTMVTDLRTKK